MLDFLKKICDFIKYIFDRKNNEITNNSLANVVRYELATGKPVQGKFHLEDAVYAIEQLENWIKENPTASSNDRAAAENVLLDLKDAIGQRPWYSQTKPPRY